MVVWTDRLTCWIALRSHSADPSHESAKYYRTERARSRLLDKVVEFSLNGSLCSSAMHRLNLVAPFKAKRFSLDILIAESIYLITVSASRCSGGLTCNHESS